MVTRNLRQVRTKTLIALRPAMIMEDNPHSSYPDLSWNRHKAEQLLDQSEGDTTFHQL
jgi:hypothetical protein